MLSHDIEPLIEETYKFLKKNLPNTIFDLLANFGDLGYMSTLNEETITKADKLMSKYQGMGREQLCTDPDIVELSKKYKCDNLVSHFLVCYSIYKHIDNNPAKRFSINKKLLPPNMDILKLAALELEDVCLNLRLTLLRHHFVGWGDTYDFSIRLQVPKK